MSQHVERRATESLLRLIAEGTAPAIGEEFFRSLVRHLAEALGVKYAFAAEFAGVKTRVRTLAFWGGDRFIDNVEYDLDGTPCEAVLQGEMCLYQNGVQARFPKDEGLVEMAAQGYIAVPLSDRSGGVLGHLALIDVKPMPMAPRDLSVFTIFAARARAELERKRAEEARARSEERLSSVLASAMDAIITIDGERHITLFNPAAERVFGCAATWAVGQPLDRFLSRHFRSLLEECIATARDKTAQRWAPEGLTALRANREEFPSPPGSSPFPNASSFTPTPCPRVILSALGGGGAAT
jgi:PAS domain S-box-containing protein